MTLYIILPLILVFAGSLLALLSGAAPARARITPTQTSWILALFSLAAFVLLLIPIPLLNAGEVLEWSVPWLPGLDWSLGFYYDSLSALFALLVTFIGTLVIIYAGQYFKGDAGAWRFLTYLMLFMGAMLGLVVAGDVLTLFIFWEGTSITSFLLVAYKDKDEEARRGAFRALFITGGGGIALLAGLVFVSFVAGGTDFVTILSQGDALRANEYYLVMLGLVAFGALTKSAQFPAHIWLPGAMSAPTPASAYLHSATMVKAGIYLLARMNPALGFTEPWFWLLTVVGLITMLAGAYLGLKQNDLKALLAYSTISQLGVLVMMIGQDIAEAYKALVVGIVAHALYKSALFLVAGIVDHEAGTRDLRRLGGLRKVMPYTFFVGALAALSMAGLPPMFGFLAKETLLAAAVHPSLPPLVASLLPWASVIAGALILAQAGLLIWDTFLGEPKDADVHGHEAPTAMWLMPAIPAALSIILSILPGPKEEAQFLAGAAAAAFGDSVKVSTVLFLGLTVPLFLSIVAISLGLLLFIFRHRIRPWQQRFAPALSFERVYTGTLRAIDRGSFLATRAQQGQLRSYLVVIITAALALVVLFAIVYWPAGLTIETVTWPGFSLQGELAILRLLALLLTVITAGAAVVVRRDIHVVLALMASGLGVALLFVLEPAPDVALVQIVVDILSLVILVLALTRLPRIQRIRAQQLSEDRRLSRTGARRATLVAVAAGALVTILTFWALTTRPRTSAVTPYYTAVAKPFTGATDIVGAVVVDFRALDTLIEITVFSMAGIGIYMLLRYAARKHGNQWRRPSGPLPSAKMAPVSRGIGGTQTSAFIRVAAFITLPLAIVYAATHMMYGHDQPGDGFTAGVIVSLAIGLWYVVLGYEETRERLFWLHASPLVAAGILLAIANGILASWLDGSFLANVDYGELVGLALPKGFYISSSFLFEVAICLAVLGSVAHMLNTLGHPGDPAEE